MPPIARAAVRPAQMPAGGMSGCQPRVTATVYMASSAAVPDCGSGVRLVGAWPSHTVRRILARHRVAEMLSNVQPALFYAAQGGSLSGGSRTGRGLVGGGPQTFQTPASLRK
jgi:hypothetical protein